MFILNWPEVNVCRWFHVMLRSDSECFAALECSKIRCCKVLQMTLGLSVQLGFNKPLKDFLILPLSLFRVRTKTRASASWRNKHVLAASTWHKTPGKSFYQTEKTLLPRFVKEQVNQTKVRLTSTSCCCCCCCCKHCWRKKWFNELPNVSFI